MANSFDITPDDTWQLMSGENTTGTVAVKGSGIILFSESDTPPSAGSLVGLQATELHPPLGYDMLAGQNLYAKRISGNCTISVTLT